MSGTRMGRDGFTALFRSGLVLRCRRRPGVRASWTVTLLLSTSWVTVFPRHARVAGWGLPTWLRTVHLPCLSLRHCPQYAFLACSFAVVLTMHFAFYLLDFWF